MKARKIISRKFEFDDGSIQELVIWEVPGPVFASSHKYKYRLYFGKHGVRIVAYDNERGKGDHKHIKGVEYMVVGQICCCRSLRLVMSLAEALSKGT